MTPNIETFIGCESSYEDAKIVLFGAPFDSTTSFRPGARFGSAAMRHESLWPGDLQSLSGQGPDRLRRL